ncbi:hypothetical protein B0T25DRAFT_560195 [Lasiosphaeria hispida]|uniref:DUF3626 domain-containing protein n=1 Tax=Lasiosphaeria hispida TaxID=260671 RepID=A0AAJ0H8A7_9PEZI|nr:hypothetical protein B0T25DRAFT_560195 [Lasiosphaeria hispida]
MSPLSPSQEQAISNIRCSAELQRAEANEIIYHVLRMSNLLPPAATYASLLATIAQTSRVAIHFHPDRPAGGKTVVQHLIADGVYRNQFETNISNGGLSASPGGARDEWERALFGGAYHAGGQDEDWCAHRPKYGALDLLGHAADGPAPRFGSCFFVLDPAVLPRCTFTFGGSQDLPRWRGTADEFDGLLAAVLEESFVSESALGLMGLRPPELVARMLARGTGGQVAGKELSRNLDHYIEAQIHGEVRLGRDVERLVADPSFRNTETGRGLVALSNRFGFPLQWHPGLHLEAEGVPPDFRGPTMPSLAARVARDGVVDACAIGDGVRQLTSDPGAWRDRGTYMQALQELKLLWHVLVRYGKPHPLE